MTKRFALVTVVAGTLFSGQHTLLPRPQQAVYGSGRCSLAGLTVRLQRNPSAEDRFAAAELARFLSEPAAPLPVAPFETSGKTILLVRTTPDVPLPAPGEKPGPDSREAYTLKITAAGGEIRSASSAGLYYAVQTARQLVEDRGPNAWLPEVEIRDWPSLAYRGTMIDTSHGPLPTEQEIKRQIEFLARWKANQYYLYSEASIEFDGYPLLNPEGRYSKEQIRRIVAYGRERHIDVVPFLELYGHLHDLLRVEHYSRLGAFPHGPELDPTNPEVMKVMADWASQISSLFPSPFVHVGFDETWQIEMLAKKQGGAAPAKLFTRQLSEVTRLFQERGKTVMAWADIVVKYPGIIENLPKGFIPVAWDYDAQPNVKKWIDPLVAHGLPHFVQTGVANWHVVAVDFDMTLANIDNFLAAGRKSQALGLINSVWLDSSFSPLRMSWPAIAYGTAAPWQSVPMERGRFFRQYADLMYPAAAAPHVADALESMNRSEITLEKGIGEESFYELWESPFDQVRLRRSAEHREDLRAARLLAEDAETSLYAALKAGGQPVTLNSLLFGARMLNYASFRYLNALEIAERWQQIAADFHPDNFWHEFDSEVIYESHSRLVDLMDAITQLREFYRGVWLAEYTPYRLGTTLGRFDAEYEFWRRLQSRFRNAGHDAVAKGHLPPLESVVGQ